MGTLLLDVRYALRVFRANPALFATAVLSLAIGIGPNSVLFSVIDAVGFRPLPVRDPGSVIIVRSASAKGGLKTRSTSRACRTGTTPRFATGSGRSPTSGHRRVRASD